MAFEISLVVILFCLIQAVDYQVVSMDKTTALPHLTDNLLKCLAIH